MLKLALILYLKIKYNLKTFYCFWELIGAEAKSSESLPPMTDRNRLRDPQSKHWTEFDESCQKEGRILQKSGESRSSPGNPQKQLTWGQRNSLTLDQQVGRPHGTNHGPLTYVFYFRVFFLCFICVGIFTASFKSIGGHCRRHCPGYY